MRVPWWLVATCAWVLAMWLAGWRVGIGWDEAVGADYGRLLLSYYASGFRDLRCNEFLDLRFYGGGFEVLTALAAQASGVDYGVTRRLSMVLAAGGTLAGTFLTARSLFGERTAWGAFALLATLPGFVGNAWVNSKDIPFACGFVWTLWAVLGLARTGQWRWVLLGGVAFGWTLGIRVGGVIAVAVAGVPVALCTVALVRSNGLRSLPGQFKHWAPRCALGVLIAWGVMLTVWPWAQQAPVRHPVEAILQASAFHAVYPVKFLGQIWPSDALPSFYLPVMLGVTLPLGVLGGLTLGIGRLVHGAATKRFRPDFNSLLLCAWIGIPVLYAILAQPNLYDGIRHFLFVLPALCILAAHGAWWLVDRARKLPLPTGWRWGLSALVGCLFFVESVSGLFRLHPYQMTFYNRLAGGTAGAAASFETDYWTLSYREAAEWLSREVASAPRIVRVGVAANAYNLGCFTNFVTAPNIRVFPLLGTRENPGGLEYWVATTRYGADEGFADWEVVHRIERAGAVFAVIKRVPPAPKPSLRMGEPSP